ncbi:nitrile hydratase subunit beta [SAR202 cluster bacterium AC-409-J13_OGT_754m]|nr:nitrile hydratase subunit beta [SAR202 cluster bacterium AC-409-J13_OGT_754m]
MPKPHDLGGKPHFDPIVLKTTLPVDWELTIDGISSLLRKKGFYLTDELRRYIEKIDPEQYLNMTYYGRWCTAITNILIEKQLIAEDDIQKQLDLL